MNEWVSESYYESTDTDDVTSSTSTITIVPERSESISSWIKSESINIEDPSGSCFGSSDTSIATSGSSQVYIGNSTNIGKHLVGWVDKARILTKDEFINFLKSNLE